MAVTYKITMRLIFSQIRRWLFEKHEVNYLYFCIFFIGIAVLSLSHFFLVEEPSPSIRLFFMIYALGQSVFEVWVFILIAYILKQWAPKWTFFAFIAFLFMFLLVHLTNFILLRLIDTSVMYLFKFLFGRGFDHLVTAFLALGLNFRMMVLITLSIFCLPLIGLLLYWWTNRFARLNPWNLSLGQIIVALLAIGNSLLVLEWFAYPYLDRWTYNKLHTRLPFGDTFFAPPPPSIRLAHPLAPLRNEQETRETLPPLTALSKPNIYLFVIETLRRDFVNPSTAPNLSLFAKNNIDFHASSANSNWTALSWFSIFHSDLPFNWAAVRDTWKEGSIPLQLLKELGYKIHIHASPDLHYFNMDHAIFGEKRQLIDHIEENFTNHQLDPCDRDLLCLQAFEQEIKKEGGREGNLYIFFLDSTHSEYSFPKNFPLKFEPIAKQINYLTFSQKGLELVKNRYRNAIFFVDSLMGNFFRTLQNEDLYNSAVIMVTGDHGEEFYEERSLFHGTHLNRYQIEVPIFCRFPGASDAASEATHIDLFPSVLHYLTGKEDFSNLFDGKSIFSKNRSPYRIAVLQNGSNPPVEFLIAEKESYLQLRFLSSENISRQTLLEVVDMQTPEEMKDNLKENVQNSFLQALDPFLKK